MFFYKYLQPIELSGVSRCLRVNLPLTVVAERGSSQEAVLWLETDAQGNVVRQDKVLLWRRKLYSALLRRAAEPDDAPPTNETVLAVRRCSRWRSKATSSDSIAASANVVASNRNTLVLTTATFEGVVGPPADVSASVQQFVRGRGAQASVYRVYWEPSETKSYAINLLNG